VLFFSRQGTAFKAYNYLLLYHISAENSTAL